MEKSILLIDDNFQRITELRAVLPPKLNTMHAFSCRDASRLITQNQFSAVVLQTLPEERELRFRFLEDLRKVQPMPIAMIDTVGTEERAHALHLGADLCIDTPVHIEELKEGIGAMLRRYYSLNRVSRFSMDELTMHNKELSLDPQRRTVTMRDQPVELLAKEFDVLLFLMRHPGIVFSKEQIYEYVWKEEHPYGSRSVADHISSIRKKLGLSATDNEYIETIRHVGYRFIP